MTEEEARKALFEINLEYMSHPPKERLKLYDEYKEKRDKVKKALVTLKIKKASEKLANETNDKTYQKK